MKSLPFRISLIMVGMLCAVACRPSSFVHTAEPTISTIEIRPELDYDQSWRTLVDLLTDKGFDVETYDKQEGLMQTSWMYSWTGEVTEYYRVRVEIRFSPARDLIRLTTEAQYRILHGYDAELVKTLKTDIRQAVGIGSAT